jgi:hypothetical protein
VTLIAAALSWHTISAPEVAWTLIGLFGLRFKIPNLRAAGKSIESVHALNGKNLFGHADMLLLAEGRYRREMLRIAFSLIIIIIGVAAMATPPTGGTTRPTPTAIIVTVGFFVLELIDVLQSALDKKIADTLIRERETESDRLS